MKKKKTQVLIILEKERKPYGKETNISRDKASKQKKKSPCPKLRRNYIKIQYANQKKSAMNEKQ